MASVSVWLTKVSVIIDGRLDDASQYRLLDAAIRQAVRDALSRDAYVMITQEER